MRYFGPGHSWLAIVSTARTIAAATAFSGKLLDEGLVGLVE